MDQDYSAGMFAAKPASLATFPKGTYYAVTWGLESSHGGMTSALLQRSRAFVREAGVPVTILTYAFQGELDDVRSQLTERGSLIDGITVLNLWEDLRTWDDAQLRRAASSVDATDVEHFVPLAGSGNERTPLRERLLDVDGKTARQTDYFREDGSLLMSHRTQIAGDTVNVHVCDRAGNPIGYWTSIRAMYRFWLDSLPRNPVAYLIIDSKTTANHYPQYRRPDAVTIYMVHGSHIAPGERAPNGALSSERALTFGQLAAFDAVVFLTERQRQDVQTALGPLDNLYVCPNSRELAPVEGVRRDERAGIAMGRLLRHKRFSHAIRAVSAASTFRLRPTLTIYGQGPREGVLRKSITKHGMDGRAELAGYTPSPAREFAASSFCLVTSSREGFGLVMLEAMAQGCVPIAYDIAYGPSDVITHGVDGYLVPAGDVEAMAQAIRSFLRLSRKARQRMRDAAKARAQDFDDAAHVRRWQAIVASASEMKQARVGGDTVSS